MTQRLRPYIPFLIVLVIEAPLLWPSDLFLGDWHNFWYAGHLVATGRSPYEVANYAGLEGPFHELEVERTSLPWPYPPWTGLFLAPFGALPLEVGLVAMHATLVVLGLAAILQLARQVRLGGAWTGALALTIAAASQPFVLATRTAHFDAALLSGVLFLAAGWQRESAWRFALGASLLALKPHLFVLLVVVTLVAVVARRRWRLLIAATAALATLAAVGIAVSPMPAALADAQSWLRIDIGRVATVWAAGAMIAPDLWGPAGLALLAIPALLAVRALRASPPARSALFVFVATALSLVIVPYVHSYDHFVLLPLVWLVVRAAEDRHGWPRKAMLVAAVVVGVVLPWFGYFADFNARSEGPSGMVPLVTLLLLPAVVGTATVALSVRRAADGEDGPDPERPRRPRS